MVRFHRDYREVTPSGGSVSFNTIDVHGELSGIRVKPTTSTTSWAISVTDARGFKVYQTRNTETGEVNDFGVAGFLALLRGVCTVEITGATVDELFYVALDVRKYEVQ